MEREKKLEQELEKNVKRCFRPGALRQVALYALFPGGKRLRPRLALIFAQAFRAASKDALTFACAIEFIHNYTLIHDDLPAMDNDDVRRGKPTVHKKFGEAAAILVGDALLTHAFELLGGIHKPEITCLVARAIGDRGVVGGQALDIGIGTNGKKRDTAFFQHMYHLKTGKLFEASAIGAAHLGSQALQPKVIKALRRWSHEFGQCFQMADDLQDTREAHHKSMPTLATEKSADFCERRLSSGLVRLNRLTDKLPVPASSIRNLRKLLDEIFIPSSV